MSARGNSAGFWRSLRQLPGRFPLWAKLITAVLLLVAIALALISFIGIRVLRSNLLAQVDSQLATATGAVKAQLNSPPGMQLSSPAITQIGEAVIWVPDQGNPQYLVKPVSASGLSRGAGGLLIPGPDIPADASSLPRNPQQAVTAGATSGPGQWRLVVVTASAGTPAGTRIQGVVLVATDATGAYRTITTLTGIDLIVSLIVLLALAAVGVAMVRTSLRPLIDIEQTAGAIAAGDLSRRVPERDPRTEVGRLGQSLNVMLSQIETAFRARAASEFAARRSEERMRQFVADASHELRTPLTAIRGFAEYYRQRGGQADQPGPAGDAGPAPGQPGSAEPAEPGGQGGRAGQNGRSGSLDRADLDRIMRRVEQESARMGVLVEDMLLLARLDQQRPLDRHPVDLLTLAADAVHDARVMAPERSINLTVGAGSALLVLGDEVRLRQVIGNLMSNALVHTPQGTPIEVRIRSGTLADSQEAARGGSPGPGHPASPEGPAAQTGPAAQERPAGPGRPAGPEPSRAAPHPAVVLLEVADHGPGLSRDQAAHVFERFYRADQARTAGGTGLGLAIVAALVAAHGGTVWVDAPPGGGAVFRIALPLAPEAIGHDPEPDGQDPEPGEHDPEPGEHDAPAPPGDAQPDVLEPHPGQGRRPSS